MKYNEFGEELPDDTPIEAPVKFRRPPSIQELIAMHVKAQLQVERKMGKEDEDDFSEDDEVDDILTPYELHAYAGDADMEMRKAEESKKIVEKYVKKKDNKDTVNKDRIKDDYGFRKAEEGIGRSGHSGKEDNGSGKSRSKAVGSGKESESDTSDE